MIIRKATPKDSKEALVLVQEPSLTIDAEEYPDDELYFIESCESGVFFVAEENDKVIGFILGFKLTRSTYVLELIVVNNNIRGKGVGSKLLNKFREEISKLGATSYFLFSPDESKQTHQFYLKNGLKGGKKKMTMFFENI